MSQIRTILENLGEGYYPWHEYGDNYVPDNIKTLDKAEQAIKDYIAKEILRVPECNCKHARHIVKAQRQRLEKG